jgi:predicted RNase H-like HicB family nuclease
MIFIQNRGFDPETGGLAVSGAGNMRFVVMIRRTGTGYSADVPDLPGCVATGRTVESTRRRIARAMQLHLELMHESGEHIPTPTRRVDFTPAKHAPEEFCTWIEVSISETVVP